MSGPSPSTPAVVLGKVSHRIAIFVIGFGVFAGWAVATAIPVCIGISYFDLRVSSPTLGLAAFFGWLIISFGMTLYCRGWIVQRAAKEVPPDPVKIWTREEFADVIAILGRVIIGVPALLIGTVIY